MENVLVIGANTRPITCSLKNVGYNVYSVDYFGCQDLKNCVSDFRSLLTQKPFHSCGFFSQNFNSELLLEKAKGFFELADSILYSSGVSPLKIPNKKLIGNKHLNNVENKFKLYKHFLNKFEDVLKLPETYLVNDLQDAKEIADASEAEKFLIKPVKGSGGIGIQNLDMVDPIADIQGSILQEIIEGSDVSASVLSTGDEASTILTTQQLIGNNWLGQKQSYAYCGNIAPHMEEASKSSIYTNIKSFKEVAEEIILDLNLIGSNGVDMKIKNGDIYLIEVNPRFQGTFEVSEAVLGINLAEAHIRACDGELINIPEPSEFAVKMIVFAKNRSEVGNLSMDNVNDIPTENVIIEEGEPVSTVLTTGNILENTICSAKMVVDDIYKNLKSLPY